jgi:hypothetical protein
MAAVSFAAIASKEQKQKAPLQRVQLEGHVVLKIAKHCKESDASLRDSEATVTGQLLGLDVGPTLEVTDCFPYPVRRVLPAPCPAPFLAAAFHCHHLARHFSSADQSCVL